VLACFILIAKPEEDSNVDSAVALPYQTSCSSFKRLSPLLATSPTVSRSRILFLKPLKVDDMSKKTIWLIASSNGMLPPSKSLETLSKPSTWLIKPWRIGNFLKSSHSAKEDRYFSTSLAYDLMLEILL
jgi:hypothetical protein